MLLRYISRGVIFIKKQGKEGGACDEKAITDYLFCSDDLSAVCLSGNLRLSRSYDKGKTGTDC